MKRSYLLIYASFILVLGTLLIFHRLRILPPHREPPRSQSLDHKAVDLADFQKEIQTGDLLFWSNDSVDSVVIQELTDGAYSHCAMLFRDAQNQVFVLDTYPKFGLRYMPLSDYLHPKDCKLVRISLARYESNQALDFHKLDKDLKLLLENQEHITFDHELIYKLDEINLSHLSQNATSIYCSELVVRLLENATGDSHLYENDYDRVMAKWDALKARSQANETFSTIDFVKLYYLKTNLGKLRENNKKILITPSGLLRSHAFRIIQEHTLAETPAGLKSLAEFPEVKNSVTATNSESNYSNEISSR